MIPVGRLAPANQWDQTMLDELLSGCERFEGYPLGDGCALIIPGRYWAGREADVSSALARYEWVLAFRTGDEENLFDIGKVTHPNIRFWVQTPKVGHDYGDARLFGVGHTPHFQNLPADSPPKNLDVFLACQRTHARRELAFTALDTVTATKRVESTTGFTHGLDPLEYTNCMMAAKIAPCPSGAVSPDSFRVFEALEAHTIPIADDVSPVYDSQGFWRLLFADCSFPVLTSYSDLPGWIQDLLAGWPANANRITAWWMRRKRQMAIDLVEDLKSLGAL